MKLQAEQIGKLEEEAKRSTHDSVICPSNNSCLPD